MIGRIDPACFEVLKTWLRSQDAARPPGVGTYRSPVTVRMCSYPLLNTKNLPITYEQGFKKDCVWRSNQHGKAIL